MLTYFLSEVVPEIVFMFSACDDRIVALRLWILRIVMAAGLVDTHVQGG